ncbi:hypothetical protein Adt_03650 [Abeliophyllum distichum]|uniref:Uncharacterized protein n=1 Tax=Abeliophyllum distichum TaxID=126358 RepID=A0ABD1VZC1_9LAMI
MFHFVVCYYLSLSFCVAEFEQGKHPRLTIARLASKRPRILAPGSSEDSKQKKVIEDLSRERNREEAEKTDVIEIEEGTEATEERILDDALRSLPFYLSMGAQAFKKYFSPRREDLASHGDLEDTLEASLATVVRSTGMQLKVLEEVRQHMQPHKKLVAEASKS